MGQDSQEQMGTARLLYDRKAAAHQLSLSVRSIDYLLANKKLNGRRKGRKVLIPHTELVRYAMSNDFQPFVISAGSSGLQCEKPSGDM